MAKSLLDFDITYHNNQDKICILGKYRFIQSKHVHRDVLISNAQQSVFQDKKIFFAVACFINSTLKRLGVVANVFYFIIDEHEFFATRTFTKKTLDKIKVAQDKFSFDVFTGSLWHCLRRHPVNGNLLNNTIYSYKEHKF